MGRLVQARLHEGQFKAFGSLFLIGFLGKKSKTIVLFPEKISSSLKNKKTKVLNYKALYLSYFKYSVEAHYIV
jgi:hypothetical protein